MACKYCSKCSDNEDIIANVNIVKVSQEGNAYLSIRNINNNCIEIRQIYQCPVCGRHFKGMIEFNE